MNKILTITFLSFFFCGNLYAEKIPRSYNGTALSVEGIFLGDSLLNYFSEEEIKEKIAKTKSNYKSKEYLRFTFKVKNPKNFKYVGIHFKNNKSYEIGSLAGTLFYYKDMKPCSENERIVVDNLKKQHKNARIVGSPNTKHIIPRDKSGKSTFTYTKFILDKIPVNIVVTCTTLGEQYKKQYKKRDTFKLAMQTDHLVKWLGTKAKGR